MTGGGGIFYTAPPTSPRKDRSTMDEHVCNVVEIAEYILEQLGEITTMTLSKLLH